MEITQIYYSFYNIGVKKVCSPKEKYAKKYFFLRSYSIWVCIFPPFVQMSERSFYNAEIIKESKTRMEFFHKSRNGQKNIQPALRKMS